MTATQSRSSSAADVPTQPHRVPRPRACALALRRKRTFDLVVGTALAVSAVPVILVLAVAVAVSLRSWPFFTHDRIGRDGRMFRFLKLRTFPKRTPTYGCKYELAQVRIPRLCGFLRSTHLDELPQLLLVPLGRMALVGPRPKMPDEFEPVDGWYGEMRTLIPQGCSGLWQVGAHTSHTVAESPEYDLFYLRYGGLKLDLWILWRTILTLTGLGRPAPLDAVPAWATGHGFLHEAADTPRSYVALRQTGPGLARRAVQPEDA